MTETTFVNQGERTADELLELIESGTTVTLCMETHIGMLQAEMEKRDGTYYCNAANKEYTHETAAEFRAFLEEKRLVKRGSGGGGESNEDESDADAA